MAARPSATGRSAAGKRAGDLPSTATVIGRRYVALMGKNNKARRAAKAKDRRRRPGGGDQSSSRQHPWSGDEPVFTEPELVAGLLHMAAGARRNGDPSGHQALERLRRFPASAVDREVERQLLAMVGRLWANGWQPAELFRQGRRGSSAAGARLVGLAMATDHAGRLATTLDSRWSAQVEDLGLPTVDGRGGWVGRWAATEPLERTDALSTVIDVLADLTSLPPLDPVLPPPGSSSQRAPGSSRRAGPAAANDPILQRVRALLAKAESTSFEAEATAFTAKAQELMTRHAIDAALLDGDDLAGEAPVAVRMPVDDPYVDAKSLLLQVVAEHGRCRAVFHSRLALSTVVGFATDVQAVEMLFTSLLVQAQTAMAAAAKQAPPGTRTRSRSYRSAFLLAYASRIGDRLAEINDTVLGEAEAERGVSLLPALLVPSSLVDEAIADRFGDHVVSSRVRGGYDPAGWAGGRVAADNARLTAADIAEQASANRRQGLAS